MGTCKPSSRKRLVMDIEDLGNIEQLLREFADVS